MPDNEHFNDSSSVTSESDELLMQQISHIFLPTLHPNNYEPISPYDAIIPLTKADFLSDLLLGLTHLSDLVLLHNILTLGFKEGAHLNREQWLHTVA
jgi:hypothetical protein